MSSSSKNDHSDYKWVTVRSYLHVHEAQMAKSFLESYGLETLLQDQHTINIQWFYSNALGGVKLQVLAKDLDQAHQLLSEVDNKKHHLQDADLIEGPHCPKCQSTKTELLPSTSKGWSLISFYVFHIVWPFLQKDHWFCHACQHSWSTPIERHPIYTIIQVIIICIALPTFFLVTWFYLSRFF